VELPLDLTTRKPTMKCWYCGRVVLEESNEDWCCEDHRRSGRLCSHCGRNELSSQWAAISTICGKCFEEVEKPLPTVTHENRGWALDTRSPEEKYLQRWGFDIPHPDEKLLRRLRRLEKAKRGSGIVSLVSFAVCVGLLLLLLLVGAPNQPTRIGNIDLYSVPLYVALIALAWSSGAFLMLWSALRQTDPSTGLPIIVRVGTHACDIQDADAFVAWFGGFVLFFLGAAGLFFLVSAFCK
jgi:hypothetical protein